MGGNGGDSHLIVVIILQQIGISNHPIVHLKLTYLCH